METIKKSTINNEIYHDYGDRWYTAQNDPIALLRAESKIKNKWILERLHEHNILPDANILDVGCGAGFLTNFMAENGFNVSGIDLSQESLNVAHKHDTTKKVRYKLANAYELPYPDQSFDIITSLDFLEHVDSPQSVIKEVSRVLKPNGLFFYHTFNRNILSHLVVIKCVEWFVQNTPKDMHVIDLFIKPSEVEKFCNDNSMSVKQVVGLRPKFSTIPFKNYISGVVPKSLEFKITKSTLLSYLGYAQKTSSHKKHYP